MRLVMEAKLKRGGAGDTKAVDTAQLDALEKQIIDTFDRQSSAFYTSGRLLDDGIIDPRDTRKVLAWVLSICREADARALRPVQFAVARH